jgi:hypothetical protein
MEFQVNVWATVKILTTSSYNLIRNCQTSYWNHVYSCRVCRNAHNLWRVPAQCTWGCKGICNTYVFHDVCHIQIITYFYGWCTVLETLGPWCLPDKKLVLPREKLERQRLKMLFFSPLMTTVEEVYLKNYIYREPINILEELNDQIHETLATVIPNVLRLARENLIKRARLYSFRWKVVNLNTCYKLFFLFCMFLISFVAFYIV